MQVLEGMRIRRVFVEANDRGEKEAYITIELPNASIKEWKRLLKSILSPMTITMDFFSAFISISLFTNL